MQIKAIIRTNKDVWREEGRAEWGGQRREQGTARAKAIPGQFVPHSVPGISRMLWGPCTPFPSLLPSIPSPFCAFVGSTCQSPLSQLLAELEYSQVGEAR